VSTSRQSPALPIAAVLLVAAVAKVSCLTTGFVWDDDTLVRQNTHIRNPRLIPKFFLPSYWRQHHMAGGEVFRPIRITSFACDYALWGQDARGYHLTSMLLHLVTVLLACLLLRKWPVTRPFWLPAALLFAVRPTDVETVVWIKNRSDLFAAGFLLAAILVLPLPLGRVQRWRRTAVAAALFAVAIMSKEVAIALPALLAFTLTSPKHWRRGWLTTLPFWLVAGAYMLVRAQLLITPPSEGAVTAGPSLLSRVGDAVTTVLCYARVAALPVNLTLDYLPPKHMLLAGGATLFAAAVALASVLTIGALRWRAGAVGVLWFAIALAPISNLIPLRDRPFAEQRLYVATLGLCILIAAALRVRGRPRPVAAALICLAVLASSALAVPRTIHWASNVQLWTEAVKVTPTKDRPLTNLGNAYRLADRLDRAATEYRRALRAHPDSREATFRLGQIAEDQGDVERALRQYRASIKLAPRHMEAWYAAGALLRRTGRFDEAIEMYRQGLETGKEVAGAWHGLALVYDQQGKTAKAIDACTQALAIDPAHFPARRVRGTLRITVDPKGAVADLTLAIQGNPEFAPAYIERARAHIELGQFGQARRDIRAAMAIEPFSQEAMDALDEANRRERGR